MCLNGNDVADCLIVKANRRVIVGAIPSVHAPKLCPCRFLAVIGRRCTQSGTSVRLGYLPGDVNGDGTAAPNDILVLVDQLNGVRSAAPPWSTDLNRTGTTDSTDVDAASGLLKGQGASGAWIYRSIADGSASTPPPAAGGGGAVVELVPQTPPPYLPAQVVTVDIFMHQDPVGSDIPLRLLRFDMEDSDPGFTLTAPQTHDNGIVFWDFSSTPVCSPGSSACGTGYWPFFFPPIFNVTYLGLSESLLMQLIIPGSGSSVHLAVLNVEMPPASGTYTLDLMNYDAPSLNQGARLDFDFQTPTTWHVTTGQLTGGTLDMVVVPGDPAGCCTPPDSPHGGACIDVIREECEAIVDGDGHSGVWQGGLLCGDPDQTCVRWVCQYAEGQCDLPHAGAGCNVPTCCDMVCDQDISCCQVEWDDTCTALALDPVTGCQIATGACCDLPASDCQDDVTAAVCGDREWTQGVACADLDPACYTATGACCVFDGVCTIRTFAECTYLAGDYLGDDTTCEGDADGDNVDGNCGDECPNDQDKLEPGTCGCGEAETDTDNDTVPDCVDGCPNDAGKTEPGVCGCGVADTDSDGDTVPDCNDGCPNDAGKTEPGVCGCGVADADSDGDTVLDCNDGCPNDADKIEPGVCGCGIADADSDGDTVPDCLDQCPGEDDLPDSDDDGIPDCIQAPVPTVSTWGLLILALLLLITAKSLLAKHRARVGT